MILFVKSAYVQAMAEMDVEDKLPALKKALEELLAAEIAPENKKHIEEEIRALRKIVIKAEGIRHHTPDIDGKKVTAIIITNR